MSQSSSNIVYTLRTLPSIMYADNTTLLLDTSPAYDLLESLRVLATPTQKGRWQTWRQETIKRLQSQQPDVFPEIRRWFAGSSSLGTACLALIPLCPQPGGIGEFFTALAQLPLADFLRLLVVSGPTDAETPLDDKSLLSLQESPEQTRAFTDHYVRMTGRQRTLLRDVLQNPETARATLLKVLQLYYEEIYAQLEEHIREERDQATQYLQVELSTESSLRANIAEKYDLHTFTPTIVVPSVFLERNFNAYIHEISRPLLNNSSYEPYILLIGTQNMLMPQRKPGRSAAPLGATTSGTPEQWANLFAALADPTRLRMLHLLAERPYYQQELATALNISGATVSHHMTPLFNAGLIRLERQAHRTNIILQQEELQRQLQESQHFIITQYREGQGELS